MKKKRIVGWIFECEIKDFKKGGKEFLTPSYKKDIMLSECICKNKQHKPIKVELILTGE